MLRVTALSDSHDVYNLTVADSHEYFANEILVHNCDVTAYSWLEGEQQALKPSTPGVTGGTAQTSIQGAR